MRAFVALLGVLLSALPGVLPGAVAEQDPRSQELLRLACSNRLLSSELTLFANGTLRLRERDDDGREMFLAELAQRELEDYRVRLREEGRPGGEGLRRGVSGEWVEQCRLTVEIEPGERYSVRFSRADTLSLPVSRVVGIADELMAEAMSRRLGSGFPVDYRPRIGDVVRRSDDSEFEIRRFTADGRGVELEGIDQPLILYVDRDQVAGEFLSLVRRRP